MNDSVSALHLQAEYSHPHVKSCGIGWETMVRSIWPVTLLLVVLTGKPGKTWLGFRLLRCVDRADS